MRDALSLTSDLLSLTRYALSLTSDPPGLMRDVLSLTSDPLSPMRYALGLTSDMLGLTNRVSRRAGAARGVVLSDDIAAAPFGCDYCPCFASLCTAYGQSLTSFAPRAARFWTHLRSNGLLGGGDGVLVWGSSAGASEPWIDRFAFEREDAEDAFVHASQRLSTNESFERLDAQRELTRGE